MPVITMPTASASVMREVSTRTASQPIRAL